MKHFTFLAVLFSLLAIFPRPVLAGVIARSTFDVDRDGWIANELGGGNNSLTYNPSGGNPGGYLNAADILDGRTWSWVAPAKFLGNVSAAYRGTLTFDLREHPGGTQYDEPNGDVTLTGGGITLAFDTPNNPAVGNIWTSYSVSLLESAQGWHLNNLSGATPTQAQFQTALASLTSLRIRGEFINGDDNGDLDNVILNSPPAAAVTIPEPGSFALLGVGSLSLLGWYCRTRRRSVTDLG